MADGIDYLKVYDEESSRVGPTAASPRVKKKRLKSLTRKSRRAGMTPAHSTRHRQKQRRRSTPGLRGEHVVGKKRRTEAQKRATRKMIAANRKRMKAKRRGKKNPVLVTGKGLRVKKVRSASRTSAAPKKSKAKRSKSKSKKTSKSKKHHAKSSKGKSKKLTKRQKAARKAARTRKHNAELRSMRAKKAARSRKHGKSKAKKKGKAKKHHAKKKHHGKGKKLTKRQKAARKAARTRKANAAHNRYEREKREAEMTAYEGRKGHHKKHRKGKRNPIGLGSVFGLAIANPIPLEGGLDFISGVFAVTIGFLTASWADRFGSSHALTVAPSQGGYLDQPAVGDIYNSESISLPIWSSGKRIAFNALAIAAPMGLSAFIKARGPKAFFQLMAFAAIARTLGKAADDGLSMAMKNTSFGLRVYAPELAAGSKQSGAATNALPGAVPGTFAGVKDKPALNGAPIENRPAAPATTNAPPANAPVLAGGPRSDGAPLTLGQPYVSGPAFNPFASTDG